MTEQNLAILFKYFADEIEYHRRALTTSVPEADALCGGIDELTRFLKDQSRMLQALGGEEKEENCPGI